MRYTRQREGEQKRKFRKKERDKNAKREGGNRYVLFLCLLLALFLMGEKSDTKEKKQERKKKGMKEREKVREKEKK